MVLISAMLNEYAKSNFFLLRQLSTWHIKLSYVYVTTVYSQLQSIFKRWIHAAMFYSEGKTTTNNLNLEPKTVNDVRA